MPESDYGTYQHNPTCTLPRTESYTGRYAGDKCNAWNVEEHLVHITPDLLWFNILEIGSYTSMIYGIALDTERNILFYEDFCGSADEWGAGHEPDSQEAVLANCTKFQSIAALREHIRKSEPRYAAVPLADWEETILEAERYLAMRVAKEDGD